MTSSADAKSPQPSSRHFDESSPLVYSEAPNALKFGAPPTKDVAATSGPSQRSGVVTESEDFNVATSPSSVIILESARGQGTQKNLVPAGARNDQEALACPKDGTKLVRYALIAAGTSALIAMHCLYPTLEVQADMFGEENYPGHVQAALSIGNIISSFLLVKYGHHINNMDNLLKANVILAVTVVVMPAIAIFGQGTALGFWLSLTAVLFMSIVATTATGSAYAVEGLLAVDKSSHIAFGLGLGGVLAFGFNVTIAKFIGEAPRLFVAAMFTTAVVMHVTAYILLKAVMQYDWVQEALVEAQQAQLTNPKVCGSLLSVMSKMRVPTLSIFLALTSLFAVFPAMSLKLRSELTFALYAAGATQVGDFIGRSLPTLRFSIPNSLLLPVALSRFALLPLYRYLHQLPMDAWLRATGPIFGIQMLQLILFGWLVASSCEAPWGPPYSISPSEAARCGTCIALACNLGVCMGTALMGFLVYVDYFPKLL